MSRRRLAAALAALVAGLVLCAWLGADWNRAAAASDLPPGPGHWCGTDRLGRSVLAKLCAAAPATVGAAAAGALLATAIGAGVGAAAGLAGRRLDAVLVWLYTTVGSIPGILRLVALSLAGAALPGVAAGGAWTAVAALAAALGLSGWVGTARLVRAAVRERRADPMVEAARAIGCGPWRIWRTRLQPAVAHLLLIEAAGHAAGFLHAGVVLGFLGAGPAGLPSWGALIDEGRTDLARGAWWQLAGAAGAVLLAALAAHCLADRLRDGWDPRA